MDYVKRIEELANKVKSNIGIDLSIKRVRAKTPTQAFSEFLTNKEQGDWAEDLMLELLNKNLNRFKALSYGRKDNLIAGDEGFNEFYKNYQDELDEIGKCPDILIFKKDDATEKLISEIQSNLPRNSVIKLAKKALAALEVRSSAFLVEKYEKFIKGKDINGRAFLSFTPKVEDLAVIFKWIQVHEVPHYYVQVFFDRIYVISFEKILEIISDKKNLKTKYFIEKNSKNQFKSTIHIDVNEGICLSKDVELPKHKSEIKELPRGRLLFHVKFNVKELPKDMSKETLEKAFNL
jgi:hypothetical protein